MTPYKNTELVCMHVQSQSLNTWSPAAGAALEGSTERRLSLLGGGGSGWALGFKGCYHILCTFCFLDADET